MSIAFQPRVAARLPSNLATFRLTTTPRLGGRTSLDVIHRGVALVTRTACEGVVMVRLNTTFNDKMMVSQLQGANPRVSCCSGSYR